MNNSNPTIKGVEDIEVCFMRGECQYAAEGACNYMEAIVTDDEGYESELYAELPVGETPFDEDDGEDFDWDGFDDYSYPILKEEIIEQAIENGISPERLKFY